MSRAPLILDLGKGVRGIYSVAIFHVVADCISFATTFFQKVISRSFRRSSSPNRTRCAGLRFGFGCKPESSGIYSVAMFHVGAKSALLRRFFMLTHKKASSARPLALPFQTATTYAGSRFGLRCRLEVRLRNCLSTSPPPLGCKASPFFPS